MILIVCLQLRIAKHSYDIASYKLRDYTCKNACNAWKLLWSLATLKESKVEGAPCPCPTFPTVCFKYNYRAIASYIAINCTVGFHTY